MRDQRHRCRRLQQGGPGDRRKIEVHRRRVRSPVRPQHRCDRHRLDHHKTIDREAGWTSRNRRSQLRRRRHFSGEVDYRGFVVGFLLGVLLLAGSAYYYFASGMAPAATADPPMPFEKQMANMALDAHIKKASVEQPAVPADEPNFIAGANVYKTECSVCHGTPTRPSEYAMAMYPQPPQLFPGKGVSDDPCLKRTGRS